MKKESHHCLSETNSKKLHIEALRILACFFVIFNHTGDRGFFLFSSYSAGTLQYWIYSFFSVFCKFAVPTFFAISGALLLPKEESIGTVYRKRVLRIVIVLLLASVGYYLWKHRGHFSDLSLTSFFGMMYVETHSLHLWYLYAFIAFLLALPLTRAMIKGMQNKHFLYLAICYLGFYAVLPLLEYFVWHGERSLNSQLRMAWISSNAIIFPFMGYYIENKMDIAKAKKALPFLWIINVLLIGVCCFATFYKAKVTGVCNETDSQDFHGIFSLVNVITIYITAKCCFEGKNPRKFASRSICSVGGCTFGIYIIHILLMDIFDHFGVLTFFIDTLGINDMVSVMLFCLIIFAAGYLVTFVLKKIPLVKKLL